VLNSCMLKLSPLPVRQMCSGACHHGATVMCLSHLCRVCLCCRAEPSKAAAGKAAAAAQPCVFTITPDKLALGPREAATVTIAGTTAAAGRVLELLTCMASFGSGSSKGGSKVFEVQASADVAAPLLHFSSRSLSFTYMYCPGKPAAVLEQQLGIRCAGGSLSDTHLRAACCNLPLMLKARRLSPPCADCLPPPHPNPCTRNVSALPLSFSLKLPAPFTCEATAWSLEPQQEATTIIAFDPNHRNDLQRCSINQKMLVRPCCSWQARSTRR
jgi:hydrocephalus-inducing protein